MRRLAGAALGQVKAVQPVGQHRIVRRHQNQALRRLAQRFAQPAAARGIARPHDHQAAFGQGARGAQRIGQTVVIRNQRQQTRVETGGGSC